MTLETPNAKQMISDALDAMKATPPEDQQLIDHQETISQTVHDLESTLQRLQVTRAERIDASGDNKRFTNSGPKAKALQDDLVTASTKAHDNLAMLHRNKASSETVDFGAFVDELIIACNNDLMLSEATESLFGIDVPERCTVTLEYSRLNLKLLCRFHVDLSETTINDDLYGLLAYRTWQLLLRTAAGRYVLITADMDASKIDMLDKEAITNTADSYKAVKHCIETPLREQRMVEFFERCVMAMPTSEDTKTALSRIEKSTMLGAIRQGALVWHAWYA